MLEWCEKLENHLSNYKWKTNEAIKRMLLSCITGSARQVIVLLQHTGAGLAFVILTKVLLNRIVLRHRGKKQK